MSETEVKATVCEVAEELSARIFSGHQSHTLSGIKNYYEASIAGARLREAGFGVVGPTCFCGSFELMVVEPRR